MKKILYTIPVILLITLGIWVNSINTKVNGLVIQGNELLGGPTRVMIGVQTAWITDLIPSGSFTPNLGSITKPFNKFFGTTGSVSASFEAGTYASASKYFGSAFTGLGGTNGCAGSADTLNYNSTTGVFSCGNDGGSTAGSDNQILTDNGSGGITSEANLTFNGTLLNLTGIASVSSNLEVGGYASISQKFFVGSTRASLSVAFEITGSYASASAYKGTAFPAAGCSGQTALQWATTGLFSCSGSFQSQDATLTALAALDGTTGFVGVTGADTFVRRTMTGTTNQIAITNGDSQTGNPVWSITTPFIMPGRGSASSNFEVLGFASVSGAFTQNSVASNSFLGSLTGPTTGTLSVGTSNNPLKILWSNIVKVVTQFFLSGYNSTTTLATKEVNIHTGSASLDFSSDGSTTKVLRGVTCFTYIVDSPTSTNPGFVGPKMFDDPFTITNVKSVASGSNAAGWNLQYGSPNTFSTSVFTANKSASTSTNPTYTSFTNSTILDGQGMEVKITSRSATLQSFSVSVCGRYNH